MYRPQECFMGASSVSADTMPHNHAWLMKCTQTVTVHTSPIALHITAVPTHVCHSYLLGQPDAVQVSYRLHARHNQRKKCPEKTTLCAPVPSPVYFESIRKLLVGPPCLAKSNLASILPRQALVQCCCVTLGSQQQHTQAP